MEKISASPQFGVQTGPSPPLILPPTYSYQIAGYTTHCQVEFPTPQDLALVTSHTKTIIRGGTGPGSNTPPRHLDPQIANIFNQGENKFFKKTLKKMEIFVRINPFSGPLEKRTTYQMPVKYSWDPYPKNTSMLYTVLIRISDHVTHSSDLKFSTPSVVVP